MIKIVEPTQEERDALWSSLGLPSPDQLCSNCKKSHPQEDCQLPLDHSPLALNADILADRQKALFHVHALICVANGLLYDQCGRERHSRESEFLADWAHRLGTIMSEIYKTLDPEGRG